MWKKKTTTKLCTFNQKDKDTSILNCIFLQYIVLWNKENSTNCKQKNSALCTVRGFETKTNKNDICVFIE